MKSWHCERILCGAGVGTVEIAVGVNVEGMFWWDVVKGEGWKLKCEGECVSVCEVMWQRCCLSECK